MAKKTQNRKIAFFLFRSFNQCKAKKKKKKKIAQYVMNNIRFFMTAKA